MPRKLSEKDRADSIKQEIVLRHTPDKKEKMWQYSLKEGGQRYRAFAPITKEQVSEVEKQLRDHKNHKFWKVSPYGGNRAYTQITCFPPFHPPLRVAEVFFPDGRVYKSRTRKIEEVK